MELVVHFDKFEFLFVHSSCRLYGTVSIITGDHPAQCKMGNLKDGGYCSCRRCHVQQELNEDGNLDFKENFNPEFQPAIPKTIFELNQDLQAWQKTTSKQTCKVVSNETGTIYYMFKLNKLLGIMLYILIYFWI
jgi:hypothetical protein